MKHTSIIKQHGAVLIFTLIMLVLLTLISTNMIRQNKVEINIAANAMQQTAAFASVESALRVTKAAIENLRYRSDAGVQSSSGSILPNHCKAADTSASISTTNYPIHPTPHASSSISLNDASTSAVVKEVYCLSDYQPNTTNPNAAPSGNEYRCFYSGSGVRNTTISSTNTADNVDACTKLSRAGGWTLGIKPANTALPCQIEIYKTEVSFLDALTNATRTVESKFEINCSADLNP